MEKPSISFSIMGDIRYSSLHKETALAAIRKHYTNEGIQSQARYSLLEGKICHIMIVVRKTSNHISLGNRSMANHLAINLCE